MSIADKIARAKEDYVAVYDKGEERGYMQGLGEGYTQGYDKGYEDGKAEGGGGGGSYDAFWDIVQAKGTRTNYQDAFAYTNLPDGISPPKYPMQPINARMMFLNQEGDATIDFVDFSKATDIYWLFRNCRVKHIGKCDFSSANSAAGAFSFCYELESIEEIVSHENLVWDGSFSYDYKLTSLKITGVIAKSGFDVSNCTKLSRASIESIMDALSTAVSGTPTITLSLVAVDREFETSEGANDGRYSDAWYELYYAHNDKWLISLL